MSLVKVSLDDADYISPFKLLFRDADKIEIPNEDKEFRKSRLKDYLILVV